MSIRGPRFAPSDQQRCGLDRIGAERQKTRDRARGFARSIKPKMRPSSAAGEEVEEADAPSVGPGGRSSPRRVARRTSPRDRRFKTTCARLSLVGGRPTKPTLTD